MAAPVETFPAVIWSVVGDVGVAVGAETFTGWVGVRFVNSDVEAPHKVTVAICGDVEVTYKVVGIICDNVEVTIGPAAIVCVVVVVDMLRLNLSRKKNKVR